MKICYQKKDQIFVLLNKRSEKIKLYPFYF